MRVNDGLYAPAAVCEESLEIYISIICLNPKRQSGHFNPPTAVNTASTPHFSRMLYVRFE